MISQCKIEGCENNSRTLGWCYKHYGRWRKHGDPLISLLDRETKVCTAEDCDKRIEGKGLCKYHYAKSRRGRLYYTKWQGMMQRCYSKNSKSYEHYGGRGITVCERWHSYEHYRDDILTLGPRPTPKHTIDRKNNDGNYELENVQWATPLQQTLNRRRFHNNKSGYVGVSWNKASGKWVAQARINGKKKTLGYYTTPEEASRAYQLKEASHDATPEL